MGALHCGCSSRNGTKSGAVRTRSRSALRPEQEHPDRGCQQPFVSEFTHNGKQRILTAGYAGRASTICTSPETPPKGSIFELRE
jgi:hypothetical protein